MKVSLILVTLSLSGIAGQAAEKSDHDEAVRKLCDVAEGAPAQGTAPVGISNEVGSVYLEQKTGTHVEVKNALPGTPDAVWLTDEYGTKLAFQENPNLPVTLNVGSDVLGLKLFAHYASCHILSSKVMATWASKYSDYISQDSTTFGSTFTESQISDATPQFDSVDYNGKTASISFTQPAGVAVEYVSVTDSTGRVLAFSEAYKDAPPPNGPSIRRELPVVTFPADATSLTACALSCTSRDLSEEIISSIEDQIASQNTVFSILPTCATAVCALPTTLNGNVLSVGPSSDCVSSGSAYTLYVTSGTATVGFATDQGLSINVQPYTTLKVRLQCGGPQEMTINLGALRLNNEMALNSTSAPSTSRPADLTPTCVMDGVVHAPNDIWGGADGATCSCVEGIAQCGGAMVRGIYFDNMGVAGTTISVVLMAAVLGGLAYFCHMQRKAREVVEGRRKSNAGNTYFGKSGATLQRGQEEIELPSGQPQV